MIKFAKFYRCLVTVLVAWTLTFVNSPVTTKAASRPFSLPFNTPPGPTTWLVGQQFGNTGGAFNFGPYWYGAGQGLHFGVDFNTPCGTDVVAIADGVVQYVDNFV